MRADCSLCTETWGGAKIFYRIDVVLSREFLTPATGGKESFLRSVTPVFYYRNIYYAKNSEEN